MQSPLTQTNAFVPGVEYFTAKNWNNITTAPCRFRRRDRGRQVARLVGIRLVRLHAQNLVFGRYDWVKPTQTVLAGTGGPVRDNYFNAGVNYKPIPPLDLALVYKRERARTASSTRPTAASAASIKAATTRSGCLGNWPSDCLSASSPLGAKGGPLVARRGDHILVDRASTETIGYRLCSTCS